MLILRKLFERPFELRINGVGNSVKLSLPKTPSDSFGGLAFVIIGPGVDRTSHRSGGWGEDDRLGRIWRFIAIVFLDHAGLIQVWQDGPDVIVMQREADREGQDVPGDLKDLDGVEGPVGRAEA